MPKRDRVELTFVFTRSLNRNISKLFFWLKPTPVCAGGEVKNILRAFDGRDRLLRDGQVHLAVGYFLAKVRDITPRALRFIVDHDDPGAARVQFLAEKRADQPQPAGHGGFDLPW